MALFMDTHHIEGGVSAAEVAAAHEADLAAQGPHGVDYRSGRRPRCSRSRRTSGDGALCAYRVASTLPGRQTPGMTGSMSAERARTVYGLLDQNGVRCWVMGGWGVDALLGRVTRAHKDLDLLVQVSDLPRYGELVRSNGFDRLLEWSESQPIMVGATRFDSAFVDAHRDGREIDVHVVDVDDRGAVVQLHADPWPLPPDTISGVGTIGGVTVRCVSRAAQLAMHSTYVLPDKHRADVRLLQGTTPGVR
jgi:lincosamide nucleotidyltransferase A/C/D/E